MSRDDATDSTDLSELEEESSSNQSLVHKLKAKIQSLQKKKPAADDEDESEDVGKAKPKKNSKVIQIVVALGVIVFLLSDEIFPPEPEVAPQVKLKTRKKKNTTPPADQTAATTEPVAAATDPTVAATDPAVTDPAVTDPAVTDPAVTDPSADLSATTTETTPDSSVDVTSTETDPATVSTDPTITDPVTEPTIDTPTDIVEPTVTEPTTEPTTTEPTTDIVDNSVQTTDPDASITDQILQDLEKQARTSEPTVTKKDYVSPPDYEYKGRGLVYNCQGLHWACVDAPSFKTCEDNASSVKYLKKKTECHPFNVYETTKGCENMQARMVTSAAKTGFCSE